MTDIEKLTAKPTKAKGRGKATRPSAKRLKALADASRPNSAINWVLRWAAGQVTDAELAEGVPELEDVLTKKAKAAA